MPRIFFAEAINGHQAGSQQSGVGGIKSIRSVSHCFDRRVNSHGSRQGGADKDSLDVIRNFAGFGS